MSGLVACCLMRTILGVPLSAQCGVPAAEAAGLEAVLKGLRETAQNDDALLAAVAAVFDGLYAAFGSDI